MKTRDKAEVNRQIGGCLKSNTSGSKITSDYTSSRVGYKKEKRKKKEESKTTERSQPSVGNDLDAVCLHVAALNDLPQGSTGHGWLVTYGVPYAVILCISGLFASITHTHT